MDGTLCDYAGAVAEGLARLRGPTEDPDVELLNDEPPHIAARRRMLTSVPGFWRNLRPLVLGFDLLHELEELRFYPHILTKGPTNVSLGWMEKFDWCKTHVPHLPIIMTEDKGLVYGKVLVDDWPPYVVRWLEWRPRGLVIVPAQPWNVDIEARFPEHCIRYDGSNLLAVRARLMALRATIEAEHQLEDELEATVSVEIPLEAIADKNTP